MIWKTEENSWNDILKTVKKMGSQQKTVGLVSATIQTIHSEGGKLRTPAEMVMRDREGARRAAGDHLCQSWSLRMEMREDIKSLRGKEKLQNCPEK